MTEEDLRNLMLNDRPGQHGSNPESDDGSVTGLLHRNTEQEDNYDDEDNAEWDSHVDEDRHSDRADNSSVHSAPDAPSTARKRTLPSNLHLNVLKFDWSTQNKWQECLCQCWVLRPDCKGESIFDPQLDGTGSTEKVSELVCN